MRKIYEIKKGERYGRLIISGEYEYRKDKDGSKRKWAECLCDCGNKKYICVKHIKRGQTQSCGCLKIERTKESNTFHGMSKTRIYTTWNNIIIRCSNIKDKNYYLYGGRGISYDSRRNKFKEFYCDMGESYNEHIKKYGEINTSIDRIDSDGNYCKENYKWSTAQEQSENKRSNINITYKGKTMILKNRARELGIKYGTLYSRMKKRGRDIEKSFTKK